MIRSTILTVSITLISINTDITVTYYKKGLIYEYITYHVLLPYNYNRLVHLNSFNFLKYF